MNILLKIYHDCRGGIILEFCLVCMLVLMIWAGLCNTALILKDRLVVIAAAREAGRYYAAINQNETEARDKGLEILANGGLTKGAGGGTPAATVSWASKNAGSNFPPTQQR
jgi:Flp pilus assembly protein TadG